MICNSCGKSLSIKHALACPKGGLDLARHDNAAKGWGALGAQALVPRAISHKPKINSRTVQGGGGVLECGRTVEQPKAVRTLLENIKGVAVVDGQLTEQLY